MSHPAFSTPRFSSNNPCKLRRMLFTKIRALMVQNVPRELLHENIYFWMLSQLLLHRSPFASTDKYQLRHQHSHMALIYLVCTQSSVIWSEHVILGSQKGPDEVSKTRVSGFMNFCVKFFIYTAAYCSIHSNVLNEVLVSSPRTCSLFEKPSKYWTSDLYT